MSSPTSSNTGGSVFALDVDTDPAAGVVRLRLTDAHERLLGANQVRLADHGAAQWEGVFDTRAFVERYAQPATEADLLAKIGVFLGETVLGPEILNALSAGILQRTLLVRQPAEVEDPLAAAFARVPWEIARPALGQTALFERNVAVRMETRDAVLFSAPPLPDADEPLRVLLVFAEAPGSRPLAMRLEREQLLDLFYDKVMPEHRVAVDVLCHGVTREMLTEKVRETTGYHVVHWSGHGHHNLLELSGEDGTPDRLTGAGLVELFADAGGFIPRLVFLSACLSGTLVRDRATLEAALRGEKADTRKAGPEPALLDHLFAEQPGYTGTALALLAAGVPQVVAMRYEVGDAYARDLAGLFYRRLLADGNPKPAASALAVARKELVGRKAAEHHVVDHATPLLFGREVGALPVPRGRSAALDSRRPRPQPLLPSSRELDRPAELVGRGEPLSRLRRCLEEGRPAVALVQGLAGLGKTALVAEAVHLWHRRFDGVFVFQSKPQALGLDDILRQLDLKLAGHSRAYDQLCQERPNARIYLPPGQPLSGEERRRQMRDNLFEAMRGERLLLVLDNFEPQLEKVAGKDGYACADPEWDRLLRHLAENLPGTGSRLVVTSRHPLAAFARLAKPESVLWLRLGPLPMAEATPFLQGTEALRRLAWGDEAGRKLALRLLEVSRGHPLILTRLGALAGDRKALAEALDALDTQGLDRLPAVFAPHLSEAERERERAYLEDVAVGAVDLLLHRASPAARFLLWVVTLAMEPVAAALVQHISPGAGPLLAELTGAGLLTEEGPGVYGFHELVRERTESWMAEHPEEQGERTAEQVWVAYGESYAAAFKALRQVEEEGSRERAVEAGRRGISYLVRARAFDRLGSFASAVVTSTQDPRLLRRVIADLEGVVGQGPPGEARWSLRTYLADALGQSGRPKEALPFYEQAVAEAEEAGHWSDVGWICNNWANALGDVGRLGAAKATYLRSAEAKAKAGAPRVNFLISELEALRVDVLQGGAERALPEIGSRLQEVRAWWRRQRAGEPVPEAPKPAVLAEALIASLDISREANLALERWDACLGVLTELEETQRALGEGEHELARTRFNRYGPLLRLDRLEEARRVLESCLTVYRGAGDQPREAKALSALADLWSRREDREQAAGLERQALAVYNRLADLEVRSVSQGNLANYLDRLGEVEKAARHRLAAIAYFLVMGHGQHMAIALRNLAARMREATAAGGRYELPRLTVLLARPEFEPLQRTLEERNVAVEELQTRMDEVVEEVRRRAGLPTG